MSVLAGENRRSILLWVRKILMLCLGVTIMSFGGILCVKSQIGLAPATVVPYVLSAAFPPSFGAFTAIVNVLLVLLQIAVLRRDFKKWQLLQFFVAALFGVTVDFAAFCMAPLSVEGYAAKWLCSLAGAALVAIGIALEILSESIPAPADSTVQAIAKASARSFGTVKIFFDCALVAIAALVSLAFLGEVVAVREGTVFLACFTGVLVKLFLKRLAFLRRYTVEPAACASAKPGA